MAVVTVHDFPTIIPDSTDWGLVTNTQIFTSPLSGDTQTVALPGARWVATLNFSTMTPNVARDLIAFLVRLKGPSGRFKLHDHSNPIPRGTASLSGSYPQVNGVGQVGNILNTKGWTTNSSGVLLPGDYFQIGDELKMVTETIDSDGSGYASLVFDPPIRVSPQDNSNIILGNSIINQYPSCIMRLEDDQQVTWSNAETIILSGLTIVCQEVFFNG